MPAPDVTLKNGGWVSGPVVLENVDTRAVGALRVLEHLPCPGAYCVAPFIGKV